MTIHVSPYNTSIGDGFNTKPLEQNILASIIKNDIVPEKDSVIYIIKASSDHNNDVGAFIHPLVLKKNSVDKEFIVVCDIRPYTKHDIRSYVTIITNQDEYNFAILRSMLTYIWANDGISILRDISPMPMAIYSSVISELISRRFALEPAAQYKILILSAIFYISQFTNSTDISESDKNKLAMSISKTCNIKPMDVANILDNSGYITSATDFCEKIKDITGDIRLKNFNIGLLYSIVNNIWYGGVNAELVAVALEHPPTWISILVRAISDKGFSKTVIAATCLRSTYREQAQALVRAISTVTSNWNSNYAKHSK